MGHIIKSLLDDTAFAFTFKHRGKGFGLAFWALVNTGIRLGSLYLLIRVVCSALEHGAI